MNEKLRNILILVASLVTMFCVIFGSIIHIHPSFNLWISPRTTSLQEGEKGKTVDYDEAIELQGEISKLDVELSLADVKIIKGESNSIAIDANLDRLIPKYEVEDGVLRVYGQGKNINNVGDCTCHVVITVKDNLEDLKFALSLGDLKITEIHSEKANLTLNLGDVDVEDSSIDKLVITEEMGDVDVRKVEFRSLEVEQSLGDVDVAVCGEEKDYSYQLNVSLGEVSVFGNSKSNKSVNGGTGERTIDISNSLGNIKVK